LFAADQYPFIINSAKRKKGGGALIGAMYFIVRAPRRQALPLANARGALVYRRSAAALTAAN
jgi:hypothetical protein